MLLLLPRTQPAPEEVTAEFLAEEGDTYIALKLPEDGN